MSQINILGIIKGIKSKTNIYTPLIEAIVNSIDSIMDTGRKDGLIEIVLERYSELPFDNHIPEIQSIEIIDNGSGFHERNRDSFNTLYSDNKILRGGKGFGRFMFLKYFNQVTIDSNYIEPNNGQAFYRTFRLGKKLTIIENEELIESQAKESKTRVHLIDILDKNQLDKGIDTLARKLLEKLLIFFINDDFKCPTIVIREKDNSVEPIVLNDLLTNGDEIVELDCPSFELMGGYSGNKVQFTIKLFKIFFATYKSKISLTAHNREVTTTSLYHYVPEFEDDFFEEYESQNSIVTKNYIIKAYVLSQYLNDNVSLERETFDFDKNRTSEYYEFSQVNIEENVAQKLKEIFSKDFKVRSHKKKEKIVEYINDNAPWHRPYINDIDLSKIAYNFTEDKLEGELQRLKFNKEVETKTEINTILQSAEIKDNDRLGELISKITDIGKSDLAHYICNRKITLTAFKELLKRDEDGKAELEKSIHNLIFPMQEDTETITYEDHNLWLLDERLVFSEYVASDKKISSRKDNNALGEPDLIIFDKKKSFRNGDNEFSNPITIFEFKRPKRTHYNSDEDPIEQVGDYLEDIRLGKYEMPEGLEKIKVNENTPAYAYIVCDIVPKIRNFAKRHQLTVSPDDEGYFGYHSGYRMYVEVISFKKLLKDANLRNKIFF